MARVFFELSDFAPLVHEIANRRRPLLEQTFSHGPKLMQVNLDVRLDALESIDSLGPITVESEFQPGDTWLNFKAEVPKLNLKFSCQLNRGTLLIKDGDWPLEVSFHCCITGRIHLIGGPNDEPMATATQQHIQVAFKDFELRCPAFPQWLESPMRRILERLLETIIGEMIPVELRRPFTDSQRAPSAIPTAGEIPQTPQLAGRRRRVHSGAIYWSAYYLGFGLTYPAVWTLGTLIRSHSSATGLRDGAHSAAGAAVQIVENWTARK